MAEDARLLDSRYDFDVFISYASEDGEWVHSKLAKRLQEAGLRVHTDADFQTGEFATVNMQRAVARSRFTLLVLSPDWVNSSFTHYETRLAVEKSLRENSRSVFPLLRRPVDNLPDDVRAISWASFVDDQQFDVEVRKLLGSMTGPFSKSETPTSVRVHTAVTALDDLLGTESVRVAFQEFRSALDDTSWNLLKLHDLKRLHDLLQQLQESHDQVVHQSRYFVSDENALGIMSIRVSGIESIVKSARRIASAKTMSAERLDWIDDIAIAHEMLRDAVRNRGVEQVTAAARAIDLTLASQPTVIDRGLVDCAQNIRLRELRAAIEHVCSRARELAMPPDKLISLTQAAAALEEFHRTLSSLVDHHHFWQVTDTQLRMVEASLGLGIEDLLNSWPFVKRKLNGVLSAGEEWAEEIAVSRDALDDAIRCNDVSTARTTFRVLRSQAVRRFTHVDSELNDRCRELRSLGEKLAFVSEMR